MQPQWVGSISQCRMDLPGTGLGSSHFYSYECSYGVKGPVLYPFLDFCVKNFTGLQKTACLALCLVPSTKTREVRSEGL